MRAPVAFVVTRHLLTDPDATPAQLARRCHIHPSSVSRALKRLRDQGIDGPTKQLSHLLSLPERPHWPVYPLRAPNPDLWPKEVDIPHWLTGEAAAALEGYDLVPGKLESYVRRDDLQNALEAAKRVFAMPCPLRRADLVIQVADPWMHLPDDPLVERGQRLYDYARSPNVQFAKEFAALG